MAENMNLNLDGGGVPSEPPPAYETVIKLPDFRDVPPPPAYEPPSLQGLPVQNGLNSSECSASGAFVPRFAYADFLPRCIQEGNSSKRILPKFEDFKTVMTILNDWLAQKPEYQVVRAESIERKVDHSGHLETESTIYFQAALGQSTYVRGIRVWLVPNVNNKPPQKLWYINVVPRSEMVPIAVHSMYGMNYMYHGPLIGMRPMGLYLPEFESLDSTLAKVNQRLAREPVPGDILTVESIDVKYREIWNPTEFNPDEGFWSESNSSFKLYVTILRIFFVMDQPATSQQIGMKDFVPLCTHNPGRAGRPRFEDFSIITGRASEWLHTTSGIRLTNLQTVNCRLKLNSLTAEPILNSRKMDYFETSGGDSVFVSTLRVVYVKQNTGNQGIVLSSRAFVPRRLSHKTSETTSQTVERMNVWLSCTGARVIGADTIFMEFDPMSKRKIDSSNTRQVTLATRGHYWISVLRLYLDGSYEEPPPEVIPPTPDLYTSGETDNSCCGIM